MHKLDLTDKPFGSLTALSFSHKQGKRNVWKCQCACGNIVYVAVGNLTSGNSTRCVQCRSVLLSALHTKPGRHTTEYGSWRAMLDRCRNPRNEAYKNYGGRGITVCEQWTSFDTFLQDMGPKPSNKHTLERTENSKGYSPENCTWATRVQQTNNTRANHYITYEGRTQTLAQWVRELPLTYECLIQRLKVGYTFEQAINPAFKRKKIGVPR